MCSRQAASSRNGNCHAPAADRNSVGRAAVRTGIRRRRDDAGSRDSSAAPAPPATAAPTTTVTDIITRATATEELRRAALAHLEQAGHWRDLDRRVTALESDLAGLAANAAATAELIDVIGLARQLQVLHRDASTVVDDLGLIVRRLEHDGNALDSDAQKWREDLLSLENRAAPAPLLERARSTEAKLRATSARVRESRDSALLALDRALSLLARVDDARARVAMQEDRVRSQRGNVERSPLWQLGSVPAQIELVAADLRAAWQVLRSYFAREGTGLAWLFFAVSALTIWLFTRRYGPDARSAQRAYGRPIAASLLIALIVLRLWAPDPPILFSELLLMLVPIPAAMVARNALPAPIPLTLYGLAVATMLIPLRGVIDASAMANRVLLLLQVICIAVPVAVDLSRGRLQQALRWARPGAVRAAALLIFAVAAVTAFSVIFGFGGRSDPCVRAWAASLDSAWSSVRRQLRSTARCLRSLRRRSCGGSGARAARIRRCCAQCAWFWSYLPWQRWQL